MEKKSHFKLESRKPLLLSCRQVSQRPLVRASVSFFAAYTKVPWLRRAAATRSYTEGKSRGESITTMGGNSDIETEVVTNPRTSRISCVFAEMPAMEEKDLA